MGYVSEISKSVLVANLPEAQNVDVSFVYNFFTRDESIPGGATSVDQTSSVYSGDTSITINQNGVDATYVVMPPISTSPWLLAQAELREAQSTFTLPRYMKLKWDAPDLGAIADTFEATIIDVPVNISDNLSNILYAEVLGNQMFSGIMLQDINVDENFYREFESARHIIGSSLKATSKISSTSGILREESDPTLETASRLISNLKSVHSADSLAGIIEAFLPDATGATSVSAEAKSELSNLLINYQATGTTYISDDSIAQHADLLDETRHVVQNIVLRNTLAGDLVRRATTNVETPYADDLVLKRSTTGSGTVSSGILAFFESIQADSRMKIGDTGTTTAQYGLQVKADNIVTYADLESGYTFVEAEIPDGAGPDYDRRGSPGTPPGIGLAGFLIDKKVTYNTDDQGSIAANFLSDPLVVEIKNMSGAEDTATFGASGTVPSTEIRDGNITYGGRAIYRVRSVYYVEMDAINVQPTGDQIARVGVLIASRGTNFVQALAIDKVPPPPPENLNFLYDYVKQNLIVNWDFPVNPQRDIKKFRVWKRSHSVDEFSGNVFNNVKETIKSPIDDTGAAEVFTEAKVVTKGNAYDKPFELMSEYDFNDVFNPGSTEKFLSVSTPFSTKTYASHLITTTPGAPITRYTDTKFFKSSVSIYAVTAVDARGMSSNLSQQFEVSFDIRKNAIVARYISPSKAPICYPNLHLTVQYDQSQFNDNTNASPFSSLAKVSGLDALTVVFNPESYQVGDIQKSLSDTAGVYIGDTSTEIRDVIKNGGSIDSDTDDALGATPVYKLHIINTDLQKDTILDIYVRDVREGVLPEPPPVDRVTSSTVVIETPYDVI
jgi:hypothetical protein